jgi:dGTPase
MSNDKMQWDKLLCSERQGHEEHPEENLRDRSPFERDFDRIIFSESFRRLKDKTQVFPVTDNDHVHNRLTHSLEVSCIGRSLGRLVGVRILKKHKEVLKGLIYKEGLNEASFGAIVQAACLAHDLGNPPFGHSGENAVQAWFDSEIGKKYLEDLNLQEKEDLKLFEGNAQGFRILTNSERQTGRKSMQLTYATLATFTKYTRESLIDNDNLKQEIESKASGKKYSFFQSDKKKFKEVANKVGLIQFSENPVWYCRHPLAFLVEAADDICYQIMDLEDGFNMGYIDYETTEDLLLDVAGEEYKSKLQTSHNKSVMRENIRFLRGKAMNKLIDVAEKAFIQHEDELLTGTFDIPLLKAASDDLKQKLKNIKEEIKRKVYNSQEVLSIEIAGYDVVSALLSEFIPAVNDRLVADAKLISKKNNKIREMLPSKTIIEDQLGSENYLNILRVTDYISGMTDSYAVSLFRKIKGIALPKSSR